MFCQRNSPRGRRGNRKGDTESARIRQASPYRSLPAKPVRLQRSAVARWVGTNCGRSKGVSKQQHALPHTPTGRKAGKSCGPSVRQKLRIPVRNYHPTAAARTAIEPHRAATKIAAKRLRWRCFSSGDLHSTELELRDLAVRIKIVHGQHVDGGLGVAECHEHRSRLQPRIHAYARNEFTTP